MAILFEEMQGNFKLMMEGLTGTHHKIEDLRIELSRRMDVLELAVRKNSEDIRNNSEDIRKNTEGIRKNSEDIRKNSEGIRKNSEDIRNNSEDIRKNTEQLREHSEAIRKQSDEIRSMRGLLEHAADRETLLKLDKRVEAVERRLGID